MLRSACERLNEYFEQFPAGGKSDNNDDAVGKGDSGAGEGVGPDLSGGLHLCLPFAPTLGKMAVDNSNGDLLIFGGDAHSSCKGVAVIALNEDLSYSNPNRFFGNMTDWPSNIQKIFLKSVRHLIKPEPQDDIRGVSVLRDPCPKTGRKRLVVVTKETLRLYYLSEKDTTAELDPEFGRDVGPFQFAQHCTTLQPFGNDGDEWIVVCNGAALKLTCISASTGAVVKSYPTKPYGWPWRISTPGVPGLGLVLVSCDQGVHLFDLTPSTEPSVLDDSCNLHSVVVCNAPVVHGSVVTAIDSEGNCLLAIGDQMLFVAWNSVDFSFRDSDLVKQKPDWETEKVWVSNRKVGGFAVDQGQFARLLMCTLCTLPGGDFLDQLDILPLANSTTIKSARKF